MKHTLIAILFSLPVFAQETPSIEKLAPKCDSQIEWISDGTPVTDKERGGEKPKTEPTAVFEEAKKKATESGRFILWYVPRVSGPHMYRPGLPDGYARIAFWTHPEIVDLVKRKFVPMRALANKAMGDATGIKRFDIVEPAIVILTADGKVLHSIDRIRTFNADWLMEILRAVLKKNGKADSQDVANTSDSHAQASWLRHHRKGEEALRLLEKDKGAWGGVERGRVLLSMGRIDEARKSLEEALKSKTDRAPEALYYLGVAENLAGEEDAADKHWRELTKKHPESPWAWHAAANFFQDKDTLPRGPLLHGFEDVFWAPDEAYKTLPTRTRWARTKTDSADVAKRAVEYLLLNQRPNGGWEDSRYCYWPDQGILPNVWIAVSAIAATALLEWRDIAPERVDKALAKAEKYFLDESRMARGKNEEMYADSFKILYLIRKRECGKQEAEKNKCLDRIVEISKCLANSQGQGGFWAHEYPNPFCTGAVSHVLHLARTAGAKIDPTMIAKAAEGMMTTRGDNGAQAYDAGRPSSIMKDSMARVVVCENALYEAGKVKVEDIVKAFSHFWEFKDRLETIRVCDFHSDGELGGFFFFHGLYFTSEAVKSLDEKDRAGHNEKLLEWVLSIPEFDGSFLDSHELGKSYGTGMALLVMRNSIPK